MLPQEGEREAISQGTWPEDGAQEELTRVYARAHRAESRVKELEAILGERLKYHTLAESERAARDESSTLRNKVKKLEAALRQCEEALRHPPYHAYHGAIRDGCDPNGAWDCFVDALGEDNAPILAAAQKMLEVPSV